MKRKLLLLSFSLTLTASIRGQDSSAPKPSLVNSTYTVATYWGPETVHLYEEGGQLKWDGKIKLKEKYRSPSEQTRESSGSVDYSKVNFVQYTPPPVPEESTVNVGQDFLPFNKFVPVPAGTSEGQALAEYVARQSPHGLELIGRAWRIRKAFQCTEGAALGCRDFKDLLDHGDADIADYFYSQDGDTHTYACFRSQEESFLILQYSHVYGDFGSFSFEEFENQQSSRNDFGEVRWRGDNGFVIESKLTVKPGLKPKSLGTIDLSSLSYNTRYPNRENTTTQYALSVRWSTGRFTESYSAKDKKGQLTNFDKEGVCVKLN